MTRFRILAVIAGVCLVAAIVFIVSDAHDSRDQAALEDAKPIRVAAQNNGALFWIALDLGYFKDAGLNVQHKKYPTGRDASNALVGGEADIAMATDFILAKKILAGEDVRIVSSILNAEAIALVASRKKGVVSVADVKGKRIGLSVGTNSDFFFANFLDANGLDKNAVEIVDLSPSDLVSEFENKNLDAVFTWDPIVSHMRAKLGDDAFVVPGQGKQYFYFLLHSKPDWLKQNASRVEQFVKALVRANRYVETQPEDAKERAIRASGAPTLGFGSAWPKLQHEVGLPQELFLVIEEQARWLLRNKSTRATEMPNFMDKIHFDALEATHPDLITMVR